MWPFVDPATKKKVKFGNAADKGLVSDGTVEETQLLRECGGGLDVSRVVVLGVTGAHARCRMTTGRIGRHLSRLVRRGGGSKTKCSDAVRRWSVEVRVNGGGVEKQEIRKSSRLSRRQTTWIRSSRVCRLILYRKDCVSEPAAMECHSWPGIDSDVAGNNGGQYMYIDQRRPTRYNITLSPSRTLHPCRW